MFLSSFASSTLPQTAQRLDSRAEAGKSAAGGLAYLPSVWFFRVRTATMFWTCSSSFTARSSANSTRFCSQI